MKLGVLYKDGKVVNHRSFLKVVINPILRYFGFCIATKYKNGSLGGLQLIKQKRNSFIKWDFNNHNDFDLIVKKRILY